MITSEIGGKGAERRLGWLDGWGDESMSDMHGQA